MPEFAYAARGRDGKVMKGSMSAQNRSALIQALREKGLTPDQTSIREKKSAAKRMTMRKVKMNEVLIFTRQLSTMVNAGLPLLQSLDILSEQAEDPTFSKIIKEIASSVEG